MNEENDCIIISEEDSGIRLDKILASAYSGIKSRTYFQMLIEEGRVLVNGSSVKKRILPKPGDEVQIHFILTPEIGLSPEPIPLDILYEDDAIIVVNKPAGLVIHPAVGNWTGTFVNALLYHCQQLPKGESLRPGIVHRLDKETSGVLVAAKTPDAQAKLVTLFASRQVYKEYLAVCLGNPGNCELKGAIGRHPVHRKMMSVLDAGGKPALTYCKTIGYNEKLSLVQIELATGRTHQIRVHMKHHGTPVLGDSLYGNEQANAKFGASRQMLHAKVLRFNHPISGVPLSFEAPVPEDMAGWVKRLN